MHCLSLIHFIELDLPEYDGFARFAVCFIDFAKILFFTTNKLPIFIKCVIVKSKINALDKLSYVNRY